MLRKPTKKQRNLFLITGLIGFIFLGMPLGAVMAADGAVGAIQVSAQIFHVSGAPVTVNMYDLTVSADYHLNWTGEDTGISFTLASTQTTFSHTFVLTTSTTTIVFYLRAGAAGTVIDQYQITVMALSDFLATGLIISAGIFILIVVIFKRVTS